MFIMLKVDNTIQENNELIAKFMNMETMQRGNRGWEQCIFSFHHSWDSLMRVIDKIENLTDEKSFVLYDVIIYSDAVSITDQYLNEIVLINKSEGEFTTKVEATYKAVVQFIEWFNNQNK